MKTTDVAVEAGLKHPKVASVALIGVSGYAKVVLDSLSQVQSPERFQLVAGTSLGRADEDAGERKLKAMGGEVFSDYRSMLNTVKPLDLCVIPTGIHWHARMSIDALRVGANVLVEKPLAGDAHDAMRIIEASEEAGKSVAVGFQDMYAEETWDIQSFLWSGALGAVRSIRATGSWPRSEPYYQRTNWTGRTQVDGWSVNDSPLNNAFAHFVNLSLFWANPQGGKPGDIADCSGILLRHYPIETFDTAAVSLTMQNSVVVNLFFTHADEERMAPVITVELDKGTLTWAFEQEAIAQRSDGKVLRRWKIPTAEECRQQMLRRVIASVTNRQACLFTARDALAHCAAIDQISNTLVVKPVFRDASSTNLCWGLMPNLMRSCLAQCI